MATNPHPSSDQFLRVLGEAVVRIWSLLPPEVQQHLFEEAASHESKTRSQLAVFLHDKHPRTSASLRQQAITEPDSLGG
jgi:hypothetical protein